MQIKWSIFCTVCHMGLNNTFQNNQYTMHPPKVLKIPPCFLPNKNMANKNFARSCSNVSLPNDSWDTQNRYPECLWLIMAAYSILHIKLSYAGVWVIPRELHSVATLLLFYSVLLIWLLWYMEVWLFFLTRLVKGFSPELTEHLWKLNLLHVSI